MTDEKNNIDLTVHYIASGSNNTFPYPFLTFENADIDVYVNETLVTSGYQYIPNDDRSAGNVVFIGNPDKDSKITISRTLEFVSVAHFQESGAFRASVMNVTLERFLAYCQQLLGYANRSMRLPPYESKIDLTLPTPINGHAIVWAKDGSGLVNSKYPADDALEVSINKAAEAVAAAEQAGVSEDNAHLSEVNAAQSAESASISVNGFDTHVAMKQSDFDTNAKHKKDEFNTNVLSQTEAFDINCASKITTFDQNYADKLQAFDTNAESKTDIFNNNAAAKTDIFNQNAAEKQSSINNTASDASASAIAAAESASEAERFRNEAEQIANMPSASETVRGAAMIAVLAEATAGTDNTKIMTAAKVKAVNDLHTNNKENPHEVTKSQIGLANVDNTKDEDKPLSSAAREKFAQKLDIDEYKNLSETTLQSTMKFDGGAIPLQNGITRYYTTAVESTSYSIDKTNHLVPDASSDITFTLIVDMPAAVVIDWPEGIWGGNDAPDMSESGRYVFAFTKFHDRESWVGNMEGKFLL